MPGSGIPPKGTVRLGCDLDMSADGDNSPFDPIGHIMAHPFNATFDGDGHKISNLTIIGQGTAATGLFGYVTGGDQKPAYSFRDHYGRRSIPGSCRAGYLTILNPGENTNPNAATGIGKITDCSNAATVTGAGNTGGIAGYLSHLSVVSGCDNTGEIIGADNIGGIAGYNSSSTITDCTNSGDITSTGDYVGGLCGIANSGLVQRSHNTGKVSASGNYVGGISGNLLTAGKIIYCSNTGSVKGGQYVGGLAGQVGATATNAYVASSFNKGDIEATGSYAGGVVGYMRRTVTACYNTRTVKGARYVGGVCGYVYATAPDPDRNIQGTIVRACYSAGQIICTDSSVGGTAGFSQGNSGSRTVVIQNCYWVDDFANARPSTIRPGTLKFGLAEADVSGWPASTDLGWGTGGAAGSHPYADNYWKAPLQDYNTEGYYPKLSWED